MNQQQHYINYIYQYVVWQGHTTTDLFVRRSGSTTHQTLWISGGVASTTNPLVLNNEVMWLITLVAIKKPLPTFDVVLSFYHSATKFFFRYIVAQLHRHWFFFYACGYTTTPLIIFDVLCGIVTRPINFSLDFVTKKSTYQAHRKGQFRQGILSV